MFKKLKNYLMIGVLSIAVAVSLPLIANAQPKKLSKSVKTGDTVYFGKYEQDGEKANGKEKIEWIVLDKKGNKALLLSKYILDGGFPYNKECKEITWENSTMRKWLNKIFLKAAFSDKEKKRIVESLIENNDNSSWGTSGGNDTRDKVFLLSLDEVKEYFGFEEERDNERKAEVTKYGEKKGIKIAIEKHGYSIQEIQEELKEYIAEYGRCWYWWLRSPGQTQNRAAYVNYEGWVIEHGHYVDSGNFGCRPALWVNL